MSRKLPKEALAFAKTLGVDLKGLEPEAEDIWKMLEEMSTNCPAQYENFIQQTFEENKSAGEGNSNDSSERFIRPKSG